MLPNLIIIGAQKCGTSALHHYLNLHPNISMSAQKELNFFVERKNWSRGPAWYESNFVAKNGETKIHGESSPDYTGYPATPGVAGRMHSIVPNVKLLYSVRHPVERIISQYVHLRGSGVETRNISEALKVPAGTTPDENRYIRRSKYYMQVTQFLDYFPRSNLFIITQEDLLGHRQETLRAVFRFLDLNATFDTEQFSELVHETRGTRAKNRVGMALARGPERGLLRKLPARVRGPVEHIVRSIVTTVIARPVLHERVRRELIEILRDDIEQFRAFSGRPFPDWTV